MPRSRDFLSAPRLRELLDYQPDWGIFRALVTTPGRRRGAVCGGLRSGHRSICVDGRTYEASHLAWLYVYGEWPKGVVDHRNGNPDDNRIANLRDCSFWQNMGNLRRRSNAAPIRGVSRNGRGWKAVIRHGEQRIHLGTFQTAEEAGALYRQTEILLRGEFSSFIPDLLPPLSDLGPLPDLPPEIPKQKRKKKNRKIPNVTHDLLITSVHYDTVNGYFSWRSGKVIPVSKYRDGYHYIYLLRKSYSAHRLAWFYVHGAWPSRIDHKDGVKTNNALSNLRLATRSQNAANCVKRRNNKSGIKGVHRAGKSWIAQIQKDGSRIYLGSYRTKEEAGERYAAEAIRLFGEFAKNDSRLVDEEKSPA